MTFVEWLSDLLKLLRDAFGPTGAILVFGLALALYLLWRHHEKWRDRHLEDLQRERDYWRNLALKFLQQISGVSLPLPSPEEQVKLPQPEQPKEGEKDATD